MRTYTVNTYNYSELSAEVRAKVLERERNNYEAIGDRLQWEFDAYAESIKAFAEAHNLQIGEITGGRYNNRYHVSLVPDTYEYWDLVGEFTGARACAWVNGRSTDSMNMKKTYRVHTPTKAWRRTSRLCEKPQPDSYDYTGTHADYGLYRTIFEHIKQGHTLQFAINNVVLYWQNALQKCLDYYDTTEFWNDELNGRDDLFLANGTIVNFLASQGE